MKIIKILEKNKHYTASEIVELLTKNNTTFYYGDNLEVMLHLPEPKEKPSQCRNYYI